MEGSLVAKDHLVSVDGYGRPIGSTLGYEVHCETCQIRFIAISILRKFAKLWRDRSRSTFVRSCQLPLVQEHCQCSLRTQERLNVKTQRKTKSIKLVIPEDHGFRKSRSLGTPFNTLK